MYNASANVSSFNTLITVKGLMPSIIFTSVIHCLDSVTSLITLITLSKWRQLRSFSMALICLMMLNECLSATAQFSLDVWHITNYFCGISESEFTGKQCSLITNIEIVGVITTEVSAMVVSMDRLYSIVSPAKHDNLSKGAMFLAAAFPYLTAIFVIALIVSSTNAIRITNQICLSAFLDLDPWVRQSLQTIMTSATYSTVICYSTMLISVYLKRRKRIASEINGQHQETSMDGGSVQHAQMRRYKKVNKVLAFSTVSYILTASVANIVVYLVEDRQHSSMSVPNFFHALLTMDGIVTFTSFCKFIPDFRKQLLHKI